MKNKKPVNNIKTMLIETEILHNLISEILRFEYVVEHRNKKIKAQYEKLFDYVIILLRKIYGNENII
jgi:hypothetical protein